MTSELDRIQGAVIRQIVLAAGRPIRLGAISTIGRVDSFYVDQGAIQIKHSSKRLPPWQFTYMADNLLELEQLAGKYSPVWAMLVCGDDGIVGLSLSELRSVLRASDLGVGSIRIKRGRKAMYRVIGAEGDLGRAKPKGVDAFVSEVSQLAQAE